MFQVKIECKSVYKKKKESVYKKGNPVLELARRTDAEAEDPVFLSSDVNS